MKVTLNGEVYQFSWKHKFKGSKRWTKAFIKIIEGTEIKQVSVINPIDGNETFVPKEVEIKSLIAEGKSHVDGRDPYIKDKGRIRSLTKALKELSMHRPSVFTRENRRLIWKEYSEMTKAKWTVEIKGLAPTAAVEHLAEL